MIKLTLAVNKPLDVLRLLDSLDLELKTERLEERGVACQRHATRLGLLHGEIERGGRVAKMSVQSIQYCD